MIELILAPLGNGRYRAWYENLVIAENTPTPFCTAARYLLAHGVAADETLIARHQDSQTLALKSTVGAAAAVTVETAGNGVPFFRKWRAANERRGSADALK